jgi:hypothetical protein
MTTRKLKTVLLALACTALLSTPALAIPPMTSYVGTLSSGGSPVDGDVAMEVGIFAAASGGSALYTEDLGTVAVSDGRFRVSFGADQPQAYADALLASDDLWLEFTVGGETMAPRQKIHAVPYALLADEAATLGGLEASAYLQQGAVDVNGAISIGGVPVIDATGTWIGAGAPPSGPRNPLLKLAHDPMIAFGKALQTCTSNDGIYVDWIPMPKTFPEPPIFHGTIDETLDDSGASWLRIHRHYANKIGLRCSDQDEGIDWMAIEPGVHTVSGKKIQAGKYTKSGGATTNDTIFFPELFSVPPVVLLMIDVSPDESGAVNTRIIGNVSTAGFQIYVDSATDYMHWIAMEPGEYTHGGVEWQAGVFEANNSCSVPCVIPFPTPYANAPGFMGTVNDVNNSGATWLRQRRMTPTQAELRLDSSTERIHWVTFSMD